ncbi:hypothetical protein BDDG_04526 [Blastomyces dermatitidis ATCC 18188]|uniref:DUF8035 domain-containing protein n=1 Tax=Ajellomyces dermatitidis (strain ATCC 18188 / CBS 674.68) TaxID=653446 RepID=F2TEC0_AJEDA|nr:hypothetical protein BDDG_04526 [Blastomyces dermatitidis ATCC 18188]
MSRRSGGRGVYERDTYELDRHDHRGNYDHVFEEDVETRFRRRPHAPDASRVREIERVRAQGHSPPSEFVRKSYGRSSSAGPLVRMPRVRDDDYEFIEHEHERGHWDGHEHRRGDIGPVHRRSRIVERRFSPPPSHARGFEREELVLRRERSRPPPPREPRFERDEFVLRREKDHGLERRPVRAYDWEWELERERSRERERERDVETERGRERVERDRRRSSYVRERSNMRGDTEEIIVRRDERGGNTGHGKGDVKREEVIIRRRDESSSSSDSSSHPPIEPPPIRAPPIHQEVITHHRHIGHGYEVVHPHPPPSEASSRHVDDEIEIRRRRERNGRSYDDEIIIDRESSRHRGRERFAPALSPPRRRASPHHGDRNESELLISHRTSRGPAHDNERHRDVVIMRDREGSTRGQREPANIRDEAEYYNRLAHKGGHIGEAYNGATKDWSIVDVPPGTKRVELEGVGGASQEITWQRYHGVRRAKFHVDGDEYSSDRERTRDQGRIGKRYVGVKDKRDRLWTEITKDLVVKEAIERAGYDYEETQYFYYVFAYLKYDDVAHLVALSDDYRQARRERIREIQRERTRMITPPPLPAPAPPPPAAPLLLERPDYGEERIIEHEVFVDADKVPLPMRARRW